MPAPRVVLALITRDNDYQREQASVAESTAQGLGVELEVLYADGDAIGQSKQLLGVVQGPAAQRPSAIIVEPVGTGMLGVATSAARNGIGWIVLNRESDYLAPLRAAHAAVPIGSVECDNLEVGRIQGRQIAALLPTGGTVLYVEGPGDAAKLRRAGLEETRPSGVDLVTVRGKWTEESGQQAVAPRLPQQSQESPAYRLIACQNDAMAMGARKAIEALPERQRDACLRLPLTGVDGVQTSGQAWVRQGLLAATVVTPTLTGVALELLARALATGTQIPERTLTRPTSYPPLPDLRPAG